MKDLLVLLLALVAVVDTSPVKKEESSELVDELSSLVKALKQESVEQSEISKVSRGHNGPAARNQAAISSRGHNGPALKQLRQSKAIDAAMDKRETPPTCSKSASYKDVCLSNEAGTVSIEENCLAAHNKARRFHGVPDLTWSASLEEASRKWAIHLADIGYMEHSAAEDYGENLYWVSMSFDVHATCADAAYSWYSEVAEPYAYNYNQDQNPGSLHFTQVVWKGTTEVGCGISRTVGSMTDYYVVCQYTPKGNWIGDFMANVPQPNPPVVWGTQDMDSAYDLEAAGQCFNKYDSCDQNSCTGMWSDFYKPYCGKECNSGC